jgi:hypothetical protein
MMPKPSIHATDKLYSFKMLGQLKIDIGYINQNDWFDARQRYAL